MTAAVISDSIIGKVRSNSDKHEHQQRHRNFNSKCNICNSNFDGPSPPDPKSLTPKTLNLRP